MLAPAALLVVSAMQSDFSLARLAPLLKTQSAEAAKMIRARFSKDDLAKGINPFDEGDTQVLFAVQTTADRAAVRADGGPDIELEPLGDGLFAAIRQCSDGEAYLCRYLADGRVLREGIPLEVYKFNPLTANPPGGMKGQLRSMGELKSQIFPDTTRQWYVYLPANLDPAKSYPVLIGCDAQWDRQWMANALENCAREGIIAPTVGIFIEPGQSQPGTYSNRSREYDSLNSNYSKFLLEEILPQVDKLVPLSTDPGMRAVAGMSSGGICSFTSCWERPDQFGVAISFVGSFANIASGESKRDGGHNYPFLIRKTEPKPIRVFLQDGENDLNNDHGSWWICNLQMRSALQYKGYDVVWNPGKGFHNTKHARRIFDQALKWWQRKGT